MAGTPFVIELQGCVHGIGLHFEHGPEVRTVTIQGFDARQVAFSQPLAGPGCR
jgi:hypothetical protein